MNHCRYSLALIAFVLCALFATTAVAEPPSAANPRRTLPSPDEVRAILERADAGDALEQFKAGDMFRQGIGVDKDIARAAHYYLESARNGYVDAMQNIAVMYLNGDGVPKDLDEALRWFRSGADHGDAFAMYSLGLRHEEGEGVAQDDGKAAGYYRQAAERGYPRAQWALGMMYARGRGVERDFAAAVTWTRKAADAKYVPALYNMGVAYAQGQGVEQNLVEAMMYFSLAGAFNEPGDDAEKKSIEKARNTVGRLMLPQDLAAAKAQTLKWVQTHAD
jgi:TPR repeat protein